MNEDNQKVSIVLPVYNAQNTLASCLDSLLASSYEDLEIIVIDDNSTDRSHSILKIYKKLDKRIKIYHNVKRYGQSICLNRALKHLSGRYVNFMSASDSITKDKIRKQVQYLQANKKIVR